MDAPPNQPLDLPEAGAALGNLHAALTQLRTLSAQPSADPFYLHAAEQVAAIVAGLQSRVTSSASLLPASLRGLSAEPPRPGGESPPAPNQPQPPNPG